MTSYLCIPVPYDEKDIFFDINSRRSYRSSQNRSISSSLALVVGAQTWITVMLNLLPVRMDLFKKAIVDVGFLHVGKDVKKRESSYILVGRQIGETTVENSMEVS